MFQEVSDESGPWSVILWSASGAVVVLALLNETIQSFTPTKMFDVKDMTAEVLEGG